MTLLFMDGFDHYATADITKKWTTASIGSIASTSGRRGGGAVSLNSGTQSLSKAITSSGTVIIGFAFKTTTSTSVKLLTLFESTTAHITLQWNAGYLKVYRGTDGGTLLGTGTTSVTASSYTYVEIKAKINDTTGTIDVYINGVADAGLALSGIDTRNGGTAGTIDSVTFYNANTSQTGYIDDIYICNNSGATNNSFLGDCRIDTILPSGDGNYTDFTPSTGTAHYALVDESTPNTTDYNSSATSGNRDSYTFPDLAGLSSQTVYGIQINAAALKSDAGARSLGTMSRLSSTDKDGAGAALGTSQAYVSEIQETDPASAAWTEANVNAAEFGVKVTA